MELDCQTKRDLKVNQLRLFLFLFSFSTPRKNITALQLNKKDPETGKMYVALYPVTRRAPKTSRAPKRDRYETLVY
jgi:hypothetical protein